MVYLKSRNDDVCSLHNKKVVSSGAKWYPLPRPCMKGRFAPLRNIRPEICEYFSQHWTGRYNTTVRCRFKHQSSE